MRPVLRHGRASALGLLLLLSSGMGSSFSPCAAAPPKPRPAASPAPQALPNFQTVAPGIYRGGVPSEAGLKKLKAMGVETVIDLRISPRRVKREGEQARQLGFEWFNLPMGSDPPTPKQVERLVATLDKATPEHPVFVHCEHGADRTGCMIGIWRVTRQGWTFSQAWTEMRRYGFNPHWKKLTRAVQQRAEVKDGQKKHIR